MYPTLPTPPPETGSIHHDGMSAIRFVIEHMHGTATHPPSDAAGCLSSAAMHAACHVAPIATAKPNPVKGPDGERHAVEENARALEITTEAIRRIAAALRRRAELDRQDAERLAASLSASQDDDQTSGGTRVPVTAPPRPQPPQQPANPIVSYPPNEWHRAPAPATVPADCPF